MTKIKKRDGRVVVFDKAKIENAILKAFLDIDGVTDEYSVEKAKDIANYIQNLTDNIGTVEEIQNIVEEKLMATKRKDVARAYITYRNKRTLERERNTKFIQTIKEKINAVNIKNQNANVDESSFGGRVGEASDELMRKYALDYLLSDMAKNNHLNNEIYIHDLNSYAIGNHNCLTLPIDDLLKNGFNTRQIDIRPANSINTAFQLVAVLFQLQSLQQFGGVAASHLDWSMVPYVKKSFKKHLKDGAKYINKNNGLQEILNSDKEFGFNNCPEIKENYPEVYKYAYDMTEKETYQAVEGMYHNLNTLQSRSGNQLPFSSINYGTCTLPEGRMVIKALLDVSIEGLGKLHRTSIFPCGIWQCMKGVNRKEGEPNYDLFKLALKSTAKRLYPNYCNVDWSTNIGYDRNDPRTFTSTMGCRTYNGYDINGLKQLKDGRGNICPVTIILPKLAMMAKEDLKESEDIVNKFMTILDEKINEAKDMLIERFEYICSQSPNSAKFMYENNLMVGYVPSEGIRSALKHGTLVVGQLGLAETLQILIGCDHTTQEGMELAKKIEELFKTKCANFKQEYKLNFGVYYTPAENLCYTAMKRFQEEYGIIKNVSDKDFFTNSIHVPVWKNISPFEKIDIESQLTGYSNAGCITYVELEGSVKNNLEALETIVNYAMDKDIPYFAINVPNDTCLDCGYMDEFNNECPQCHSQNIQQLRRVTRIFNR
jgi:ribonucleoside-triphosphate reductase